MIREPFRRLGHLLLAIAVTLPVAERASAQAPPDKPAALEALFVQREDLLKKLGLAFQANKPDESAAIAEELAALETKLLAEAQANFANQPQTIARLRGWSIATHQWLAKHYEQGEKFPQARAAQVTVFTLAREEFGRENWRVTDALLAIDHVDLLAKLTPDQRGVLQTADETLLAAGKLRAEGRMAEAKAKLEAACDLRRSILGEKHRDVAVLLNNIAELTRAEGDLPKAVRQSKEAFALTSKIFGEYHPAFVTNLINLAGVYQDLGEYSLSEPLCQLAVKRAAAVHGKDHPEYARALNHTATLLYALGDYAQAEPIFRDVLALRKAQLGDEHPHVALSLDYLGDLYLAQGDFARAEPLFRQALAIRKATIGEAHPQFAQSLANLARLYQAQGDNSQAAPLYQQALDKRKAALGEKHPQVATTLSDLGQLYFTQGDFAKAEPLFEQALEIQRATLGRKHPSYAASLNNLATLYDAQADFAKAQPLYEQALELAKTSLGEKHPHYATTLGNLAALHEARGELDKAEPLYRQAMTIRKDWLSPRHPDFGRSCSQLALVLAAQKKTDEANALHIEALNIFYAHLSRAGYVQSERQQLAMGKLFRVYLDAYLAFAADHPRHVGPAYDLWLTWKGRVWQQQREARAIEEGQGNAQQRARLAELRTVATRLATLTLKTPEPNATAEQVNAWLMNTIGLHLRLETLERELAGASAAFHQASERVGLTLLTNALPKDTALVDYVEITQAVPGEPRRSERRLLAFVVRPLPTDGSHDSPVSLLDLGPAAPLAKEIDTWRATHGRGVEAQRAGGVLRDKIWSPVEAKLAGAKLVLVSPDGILGRLPLAALPSKAPGKYLLEEWALATIPVPQMLPTILKDQPAVPAGVKNLLLIGDVDYDAGAPMPADPAKPKKVFGARPPRGSAWRDFPHLDGTQGEVASIEKMYRDLFGADGCTTLEKKAASEERFTAEAPRHRYLHIATHGFFAAPELRSTLAQAGGERGVSLAGFHPSLLSGLALAGANREPTDEREDGILTAEEAETLDLRHVELATLSACETGLGEVAGGEGVLGLQRAFQVAGARTTITSLWKVDDTQTRALMERFYRNLWEKEMTKLEALREAQLWMLREGSRGLMREKPADPQADNRLPPYYWAPFVLSGDWR